MRLFAILAMLFAGTCAGLFLAHHRAGAQDSVSPRSQGGRTQEGAEHHSSADMKKHMQKMNEMMLKHLGSHDEEFELRFIDMMIPHHEGAILTAKQVVEHSSRAELKAMAEKSIKEQQKEIEELKQMRKEWYGR